MHGGVALWAFVIAFGCGWGASTLWRASEVDDQDARHEALLSLAERARAAYELHLKVAQEAEAIP